MTSFSNINALIIDMDGVLWHGSNPLPGLNEFFNCLRKLGLPFILATNNASQTNLQYVAKLDSMGVKVDPSEILTSGMATANYLSQQFNPADTRIFIIGENGIKQPLESHGFTLTGLYEVDRDNSNGGADLVVCGLDKELSWDKLATAALNINAGARFFSTNGDTTLPTEQGVVPGNGATLAALEAATGAKPIIIGKPEPIMYQQAIKKLGANSDQTIAIGDRLNTDILGAVRAGIRSLMVLTGISTESDIDSLDYQPTWVMQDIREVTRALNRLADE